MEFASLLGSIAAPISHDGMIWAIPFCGLLASIAIVPLAMPRFWHRHYAKLAFYWVVLLAAGLARRQGVETTAVAVWQQLLGEYLPFMALQVALYTVGGGIMLDGGPWGTPRGNTLLLALGTLGAGLLGTNGVAMVLIHPLLRANAHRRTRWHLVLFFILLCCNIGGITSPLGNPPLYVGFQHGVPFMWPALHLWPALLMTAPPLLAVFWLIDRLLSRRDRKPLRQAFRFSGWLNLALIFVMAGLVLAQGLIKTPDVAIAGAQISAGRLAGALALCLVAWFSHRTTPAAIREGNLFSWEPLVEVAVLFAAIFVTVIPVEGMLEQGEHGPLASLIAFTRQADGGPSPVAYFVISGVLSALLDNAPTYLVFFQLAGDDAARLTGEWSRVLLGLSAGACFFGGLTYIGNAPNMVVRSIAAHRGVAMPSFFAYAGLAILLMAPWLALVAWWLRA
jgi:Na+/H+ antiporter NhaD/arsenite permease-like protein